MGKVSVSIRKGLIHLATKVTSVLSLKEIKMSSEYIKELNRQYGTNLTGISPAGFVNSHIPNFAKRVVVQHFGNGIIRVFYVDSKNRLITIRFEEAATKSL